MIRMLTGTQAKIILILLNDKGHAEWEIAEFLHMKDSNLNSILKKLKTDGIIYQGDARISGKKQRKVGEFKEFPYYITKELNVLKKVIRAAALTQRELNAGPALRFLIGSIYMESMRDMFGKDVDKIIDEELLKCYPPYTNPFIRDVLKVPLEDILFADSRQKP